MWNLSMTQIVWNQEWMLYWFWVGWMYLSPQHLIQRCAVHLKVKQCWYCTNVLAIAEPCGTASGLALQHPSKGQ